jgi:GxxExxY protein
MSLGELKYSHLTVKVIGYAMTVRKTLGNGFQEVIYRRALGIELRKAKMPFLREYEMPIYYSNEIIGTRKVDFLIYEMISIELKAIASLEMNHLAQAINYLEAFNLDQFRTTKPTSETANQ